MTKLRKNEALKIESYWDSTLDANIGHALILETKRDEGIEKLCMMFKEIPCDITPHLESLQSVADTRNIDRGHLIQRLFIRNEPMKIDQVTKERNEALVRVTTLELERDTLVDYCKSEHIKHDATKDAQIAALTKERDALIERAHGTS